LHKADCPLQAFESTIEQTWRQETRTHAHCLLRQNDYDRNIREIVDIDMNIWNFQKLLSQRLLKWAGVSTVLGVVMSFFGVFWRGVGSQFVGWAAINAAIAVGGDFAAQQRRATRPDSDTPKSYLREGNTLRRLLMINSGLDVLYMIGGMWTARRTRKPWLRGVGLGVILQGLALFIFDLVHARQTPSWPWEGSDPR